MLDSVNLVQFKKAFRGNLSDMLVITEACVEKNPKSLTTGAGVISLSKSVILNDDSFFKNMKHGMGHGKVMRVEL